MKKTLAILLALVMLLSLATVVLADDDTTSNYTITIDANPDDETFTDLEVTYNAYKILDVTSNGTAYSYTLATAFANFLNYSMTVGENTVSVSSYLTKNDAGYVVLVDGVESTDATAKAIAALAEAYVNANSVAATATGTAKENNDYTATLDVKEKGYYLVTSSLGANLIVDTVDGSTELEIDTKNELPTVDKSITGGTADDISEDGKNAIAQVGSSVEYTATVTAYAGTEDLVYFDTMSSGLSFNNDIIVKVGNDTLSTDKYTVSTTPDSTKNETWTFKVTFTDSYLESLTEETEISITYFATVTNEALTVTPETNDAYIEYGNGGTSTHSKTNVYSAKITVVKTDSESDALAGAGFVLSKTVTETVEEGSSTTKTVYYKYTAATEDASAKVEWVESIGDATELTTQVVDGKAEVSFTGLQAGTYTIIEKTVPDGYNKAEDVSVTINATGDSVYTSTNLEQSKTVVNKSGTELPSTGGIGTTLFYVFGAVLVVGAAVLLVTKKRMSAEA